MDPFSITAGIAGLLSLSIQTYQIVTKHIEAARNAPKEAQALAAKLEALVSVLEQLEQFTEKHAGSGHFTESSILYGTTKRCDESLQNLYRTLSEFVKATAHDNKSWRKYMKWPLSKAKHEQVITLLHEYLEVFDLSISIDGL
jgi:hypothetical protein